MAQQENIIKVQFIRPVNGQTEFYFGSLAAIYDTFSPAQIGCTLHTLWRSGIDINFSKATNNCIISKHKLLRKSK